MLKHRFFFAVTLLLTVALSAQVKPPKPRAESRFGSHLPPATIAAMQGIRPDNIETHVHFLSHDLLEGRGTGQRGGDIAAEYIAAQFALYGLKPAGDNGTYMQKVPLVGIMTLPETRFEFIFSNAKSGGGAATTLLKPLDEYVAYDQTQQLESKIDAEIVYVGYGIEAPEYKWDDYKGVDVQGKVLLMLVNEPPSDDPKFFAGKALTYYGRWTYKYEEAARKGPSAPFSSTRPRWPAIGWDVVRNSNSGEKVLSQARRHSTAQDRRLDPIRSRPQPCFSRRHGSRQDDGGGDLARLQTGAAAGVRLSRSHVEQGSSFRIEQCDRRASGIRRQC